MKIWIYFSLRLSVPYDMTKSFSFPENEFQRLVACSRLVLTNVWLTGHSVFATSQTAPPLHSETTKLVPFYTRRWPTIIVLIDVITNASLHLATAQCAWECPLPCAAVASQKQMVIVQRSYRRWNCRCLIRKSWKSSSCHQKTLAALLFWRWHHAYCMFSTRLECLQYGSVGSDMDSSRRHTKQLTISVPYLLVI